MTKLKTFIYVFKKSISSPEYYKELLATKLAYTIKYYLFLSLILSLVISCVVSIKAIPNTIVGLKNISGEIKKIYPDDLLITVKDSKWTINKPEPYIIPLPETAVDKTKEDSLKNIIVFYKVGTIEDFNTFKTFALVNETNILTQEDNSGIKATPISKLPDFDADKSKVNEIVDRLYSYLKYLPYFLPLILFFDQFILNYIGLKILYIIWVGFVLFLFSLIRRNKISYISAVRVGIHTMTLPLILEAILYLAKVEVPISKWIFVVNVILAIFVLEKITKKEETLNPKI
jgi:hypothetical protein